MNRKKLWKKNMNCVDEHVHVSAGLGDGAAKMNRDSAYTIDGTKAVLSIANGYRAHAVYDEQNGCNVTGSDSDEGDGPLEPEFDQACDLGMDRPEPDYVLDEPASSL